jgi:hypothetical protein
MQSAASIKHDPAGRLFPRKLRAALMGIALLCVCVSLAGKWIGGTVLLGGHSEDRTHREIVIGNNVLSVPSNAIRFEQARVDGVASRLDLYLHWPDLEGYTAERRDAFNNRGGNGRVLFLSIEEALMARDMSGRLEPIYRRVIEPQGRDLDGGLTAHAFTKESGFRDEELVIGTGKTPFVARCLTAKAAADLLASCERDIRIGEELSLSYRFPRELLAQANEMDAAVRRRAQAFLRTPQ